MTMFVLKFLILFLSVQPHMMHDPCGHLNSLFPSMTNCLCSHLYPKPLSELTVALENGKIIHRRRDTGIFLFKHTQRSIVKLDNKWVVPYNPYFVAKYDSHKNEEVMLNLVNVKMICFHD
jgi:hypothetical protein